jgi:hypothetical protein
LKGSHEAGENRGEKQVWYLLIQADD